MGNWLVYFHQTMSITSVWTYRCKPVIQNRLFLYLPPYQSIDCSITIARMNLKPVCNVDQWPGSGLYCCIILCQLLIFMLLIGQNKDEYFAVQKYSELDCVEFTGLWYLLLQVRQARERNKETQGQALLHQVNLFEN
jgi:hypothetical protein